MLGLGEERDEILQVMADLREVSCDLLTLGQYLQPSGKHHPVVRFVTPEEFEDFRKAGEEDGLSGGVFGALGAKLLPRRRNFSKNTFHHRDRREHRGKIEFKIPKAKNEKCSFLIL